MMIKSRCKHRLNLSMVRGQEDAGFGPDADPYLCMLQGGKLSKWETLTWTLCRCAESIHPGGGMVTRLWLK